MLCASSSIFTRVIFTIHQNYWGGGGGGGGWGAPIVCNCNKNILCSLLRICEHRFFHIHLPGIDVVANGIFGVRNVGSVGSVAVGGRVPLVVEETLCGQQHT